MIPRLIKVFFICTLLTACTVDVDGWELKKAIESCKDKGGIDYLESDTLNFTRVRCMDGSEESVKTAI